jgi:hypothetical protein
VCSLWVGSDLTLLSRYRTYFDSEHFYVWCRHQLPYLCPIALNGQSIWSIDDATVWFDSSTSSTTAQRHSRTESISYDCYRGWSPDYAKSLAASLAIGAMVKFGVTHPPAGAAAMIFATGAYGWGNLLFVLLGTALSTVVATIVNNSSHARQYPTYWGFPPCSQLPSGCAGVARKGEKQSSESNETRAHVAIGDSNAVRRLSDSLHC